MSKFYIILILILLTLKLPAQDFGSIGTEWYYSEAQSAPTNSEYIHFESVEDTIINGQTTHKIVKTYYMYNGDTAQLDPIYVYQQSDTAFMYSPERSKFIILYVFNGEQGDTLTLDAPYTYSGIDTTYRLVIDTVINTVVDGIPLKKYGTTALDEFRIHTSGGYFMDRIGSLDWFFPETEGIPEKAGPLRCYADMEIDTSLHIVVCDYRLIASIEEIGNDLNFEIYPNPVDNYISVELPDKNEINEFSFNIIDFAGRHINSFIFNENINVSKLSAGLYFLCVHDSNNKIIKTLRFIKK